MKHQKVHIALHTEQTTDLEKWLQNAKRTLAAVDITKDKKRTRLWWQEFWQRSFIRSDEVQASVWARNYTLFRYMLGCRPMVIILPNSMAGYLHSTLVW